MRTWKRRATVLLAVGPFLMAACASNPGEAPGRRSNPEGSLHGSAGPVTWEIIDVRERESLDGKRTRWYYTIVFKETQGRFIQFQREEFSWTFGGSVGGSRDIVFERRLEPYSELRVSRNPWSGSSDRAMTIFYRFKATDGADRPITVDIQLSLFRGTGRRMANPEVTRSLPSARSIAAGESSLLTGAWRGYSRDADGFAVPLSLAVKADGSFEAAADDPPRYFFRGFLRVRDGRVVYSTGSDTGTLTLHEGGGRRVLEGAVTGPRHGPATQAAFDLDPTLGVLMRSPGPTYTPEYKIWLEPHP